MWLQTLWLILTYSYNAILVLFIAIHLFVGAIISFLTGLYGGVYLAQNYEIPRISEPRTVWDKFWTFLEKNRRNPQNLRWGNILRPATLKELVVEPSPPSPSLSETILVPTRNQTASYTQSGCQTENVEDGEITTDPEHDLFDFDLDRSEPSDTITADSLSHPVSENSKTLILTEAEDLAAEWKSISSAQIVEASLTLDKNKAISRSASKLN